MSDNDDSREAGSDSWPGSGRVPQVSLEDHLSRLRNLAESWAATIGPPPAEIGVVGQRSSLPAKRKPIEITKEAPEISDPAAIRPFNPALESFDPVELQSFVSASDRSEAEAAHASDPDPESVNPAAFQSFDPD